MQVEPTALDKLLVPVMDMYGQDLHALLVTMLSAEPAKRPSAQEIMGFTFLHPIIPSDREPALAQGPGHSPPSQVQAHETAKIPPAMLPKPRSAHDTPAGCKDHLPAARNLSPDATSPTRATASGRTRPHSASVQVPHEGEHQKQTFSNVTSKSLKAKCPQLHKHREFVAGSSVPELSELEGMAHQGMGLHGSVLYVSKRPERHEYGSVSEAVRWALPGSAIEVLDGIYQEEIVLDKVGLLCVSGIRCSRVELLCCRRRELRMQFFIVSSERWDVAQKLRCILRESRMQVFSVCLGVQQYL